MEKEVRWTSDRKLLESALEEINGAPLESLPPPKVYSPYDELMLKHSVLAEQTAHCS